MASRIKQRGKVFRDPVHRLIRVETGDDFILDLIDTPVFQRLRRIRQLGVSSLTYHGAEHSRFSHSLGVFNFAQRICKSLIGRYKGNDDVTDYLKSHEKELKAAALLHDIGHGPFSHMLERAFDHSSNHEDRTIQLIRDTNGDIANRIGEHGIDPEKVAEIIQKTSKDRLIVDVVSSQLDADRMDYLLRDSLHTGVEYGRFDAEWLVQNLCIGLDPKASTNEDNKQFTEHRLCLDRDRGVHTAEQLIMARLHMTMQVYMHRVTRGYEVLLLNLFQLASKLASEGKLPQSTPEIVRNYFETKGQLTHEQWLEFDEMAMYAALANWASCQEENDLRRMSHAFLRRERILRARVIDLNKLGLERSLGLPEELMKVGARGVDWQMDDGKVMPYKGWSYDASHPSQDSEEQSALSILLATGDVHEKAVAVETISEIFKTLDFNPQKIGRVYYDREKASVIEPVLDKFGITEER